MKRGLKKHFFKTTITIFVIVLAVIILWYSFTVFNYSKIEFKKDPYKFNLKNPCSEKNIEYDSCRVWIQNETFFDKCDNKVELKDLCFTEIAANTFNSNYCDKISDEKMKENCDSIIEIIPVDPNYLGETKPFIEEKKEENKGGTSAITCEGITDENQKQECINNINELPSLK